MKDEPKGSETDSGLLRALGSCTSSQALGLFGEHTPLSPAQTVAAACAMVCAVESLAQRQSEFYEKPLDALAKCSDPTAKAALFHFAQHVAVARVQIAAIERLGVCRDDGPREFLRKVAKDGLRPTRNLHDDRVRPEDFQIAALKAIHDLVAPTSADEDCVIDVLSDAPKMAEEAALFSAAVEALFVVCSPASLDRLLKTAESYRGTLQALRIIAIASKFSPAELAQYRPRIATVLCDALRAFERDEEVLRSRLASLARNAVGPELLNGLAERYPGDSLDNGRGLISAAALEAAPTDETFVHACLQFARTPANLNEGSRGLKGLVRCVENGHGDAVALRIVRDADREYGHFFGSAALLRVFGDEAAVMTAVCDALDQMQPEHVRNSAAHCCDAFARIAILDAKNCWLGEDLSHLRYAADRRDRSRDQSVQQIAAQFRTGGRGDRLMICLSAGIVGSRKSTGRIAVGNCLL